MSEIEPVNKEIKLRKTIVPLAAGEITVYMGSKVANALKEVTADMPLYKGVRLGELLGAVYQQGKKDGARAVFEAVDIVKKEIKHKNPGKPKSINV